MPIPDEVQPLESYQDRIKAEIEINQRMAQNVIDICNQAMRTARRECPIWDRTPRDCEACGNEPCVKAWRKLEEMWRERP